MKILKSILFILAALALTAAGDLLAQERDEWIDVTFTADIPEDKSVSDVKKELLSFARQKAIEQKTGVLFQSTQISNTFSATSGETEEIFDTFRQLTKATVGGKIVDEEEPAYQQPAANRLTIRYRAKIEEEKQKPNPAFQLACNTNRSVYQLGDALEITVTPTKDAYITIFSVTQHDRVSVLFPNQYMSERFVRAHSKRKIPNRKESQIITFTLQEPRDGNMPYAELLMCVATKEPISFDRLKSETNYSKSWLEVNRWLMNIPANMRTEQYVQYQVVD